MIEGDKVNLRAMEEADIPLFHRWFNDPEVTRFLDNVVPALSLAQERALVQRLQEQKDSRNYTITLKDGTPIGSCALRNFDWITRSCEAGITIGEKDYWGKGYGGEALEVLQRIAFESLNLHKVWLTCAEYNERGLRAYQRIGFREEGRLRDARFIDGRYYDTVIMGVLENEWRAKTAQAPATETAAEAPAPAPAAQPAPAEPQPVLAPPASATAQAEAQPVPAPAAPATASVTPAASAPSSNGTQSTAAATAAAQAPAPEITPIRIKRPATAVRPSNGTGTKSPTRPQFVLTLQKTYYEQGFFNVPVEIDERVRQTEGPIELLPDDTDRPIVGRLDRKTNPNGTARIFGGTKLRNWFRTNFQVMDPVEVDLGTPGLIRLRKPMR